MPNNVAYSSLAVEDLEDIHDYLYRETFSRKIADAMIARIETTARTFATQPRAGAECPEYLIDGRYFIVRNDVVIYRPRPDGIEIARILHGAMDLKRFFPDGDA